MVSEKPQRLIGIMTLKFLIKPAKTTFHWLLIPVAAIFITLWPTLSSGLELLQTDPGDTLLNHYFLEHAYQHIRDGQILNPENFWSPNFFWPVKDTLAWSDHLIGPALLYGLFRTFISDPYPAYAGWLSLTLGLNYVAMRRALMAISPATTPAWLSLISLITVFSPAITIQLSHPQLLSLFLMGPILVLCNQLLAQDPTENFTLTDWLMLGFWLLCNGIFNIYIFVYGCYGALACASIHVSRRLRKKCFSIKKGIELPRAATALLTVIAINLIIYIPYLNSLQTFGERPSELIIANLPKPASWIFSRDQWLIPPLLSHGQSPEGWISGAEQELFPGWLFIILLVATAITAFSKKANTSYKLKLWLLALSFLIVGSISIMDFTLWPFISKALPGASSLRASSRVGMVIVLFAAPSIALASTFWIKIRTLAGRSLTLLFGFGAAFSSITAVNQPFFSLKEWRKEHKLVHNALTNSDCDVFWMEWEDGPEWRSHVQAMHAQLSTGIPTVNGYSGHFPKPNWPYRNPSGDGAYAWMTLYNPGKYHNLRPQPDELNRCIVSVDTTTNTSELRQLEFRNGKPIKLDTNFNPGEIIYANDRVKIAVDNNYLLFGIQPLKGDQSDSAWRLLTRDGKPIPAVRGNYSITNAIIKNNKLLIADTDLIERLQYTWKINLDNGVFEGQSLKQLDQ